MAPSSANQWDFLAPDGSTIDFSETSSVPYFIFYLWGVWTAFWLAGLIVFGVRLRTSDSNIKMRSPTLVVLSAFGAELCFSCTAWAIAVTRPRFPCFLDLYYVLLGLPLYFVPFLLRFVRYIVTMSKLLKIERSADKLRDSDFWLRESSYVAMLGVVITLCLCFANVVQSTSLAGSVNAYGCELRDYTKVVLILLLAACVVGVAVGFIFLRTLPDPYNLKTELVMCFVVWMLTLVPYLVLYLCVPDAADYLGLLMFAFIAAGYYSSVIWPIYLSYKRPPAEASGEILATVEDVLMDTQGFELIRKVAQAHFGTEMCECARAILRYRMIEDEQQMRDEAEALFETYVRPGAPKQCNFSGPLVQAIQERKSRAATSDLFNRAYQELVKLIGTNYFREVRGMPEYTRLVNERQARQDRTVQGRAVLQH
jgi:NTP pyrophosphatase (non-canonical NTP hydrolase)